MSGVSPAFPSACALEFPQTSCQLRSAVILYPANRIASRPESLDLNPRSRRKFVVRWSSLAMMSWLQQLWGRTDSTMARAWSNVLLDRASAWREWRRACESVPALRPADRHTHRSIRITLRNLSDGIFMYSASDSVAYLLRTAARLTTNGLRTFSE